VNVRLHCIVSNLKSISKLSTLLNLGKISAYAQGKGAWSNFNESLPITAVRNTAEQSFSKLKLIKTFYRSTMTDERLTNLAMISIKSEIAKILDMPETQSELTKTFAFLKTWKMESHFPSLKHSKCSKSVCFVRCVDAVMLL